MPYQSEAQLEKNMVQQLQTQGYEPVKIDTYEALVANYGFNYYFTV